MFIFAAENLIDRKKMENEYVMIKKSLLDTLCNSIVTIRKGLEEIKKSHHVPQEYYTNQEVREILQVNDKLIRKYRESGLLEYTQCGSKYWYSAKSIEQFLENCKS